MSSDTIHVKCGNYASKRVRAICGHRVESDRALTYAEFVKGNARSQRCAMCLSVARRLGLKA